MEGSEPFSLGATYNDEVLARLFKLIVIYLEMYLIYSCSLVNHTSCYVFNWIGKKVLLIIGADIAIVIELPLLAYTDGVT